MNILRERLKIFRCQKRVIIEYQLDELGEALLSNTDVNEPIESLPNSQLSTRVYHWVYIRRLLVVIMLLSCVPILPYIFLLVLSKTQALMPIELKQNHYNILLVVAHPDDECLFFSPTVHVLQKRTNLNLSLLVFSHGNHSGLGSTREKELYGSCKTLNIPEQRCISLDLSNIQDNPKVWWSEGYLIPIINQYINNWSIDILISFDNKGVSGHINHRAVGAAVRLLTKTNNNTMIKMSYELKSVSLLRKYSSLLDFYITFILYSPRLLHSLFAYLMPRNLIGPVDSSRMLLINTPKDYLASRRAFANHRTQYSWDRHLYLVASRYMFINELLKIE